MNNDIIERYCSFEVSKLLKIQGFTWNSFMLGKPVVYGNPMTLDNKFPCYDEDGKEIRPGKYTETNGHYPRPSQAVAIDWVFENIGVYISILPFSHFNIELGDLKGHKEFQVLFDNRFRLNYSNDGKNVPFLDYISPYRFASPQQATDAALTFVLNRQWKPS